MVEFRDFPQALLYWSEQTGQEPWLFEREGHDWQWCSWQDGARQLQRVLSCLGPRVEGKTVGFTSNADPYSWMTDLAVLSLGAVAVPVGQELVEAREDLSQQASSLDFWAVQYRGEALPRSLPRATELLELYGSSQQESLASGVSQPSGTAKGAGAASRAQVTVQQEAPLQAGSQVASAPESRRVLSAGALLNRAAELAARLEDTPQRDVVVFHRSLDWLGERITWAWALAQGAAAVLEPETLRWPVTVAWARPTLLQGSAAELTQLRLDLESLLGPWFKRRFRRRMSRLRAVVVVGRSELGGFEDRELWESLGAQVVAVE